MHSSSVRHTIPTRQRLHTLHNSTPKITTVTPSVTIPTPTIASPLPPTPHPADPAAQPSLADLGDKRPADPRHHRPASEAHSTHNPTGRSQILHQLMHAHVPPGTAYHPSPNKSTPSDPWPPSSSSPSSGPTRSSTDPTRSARIRTTTDVLPPSLASYRPPKPRRSFANRQASPPPPDDLLTAPRHAIDIQVPALDHPGVLHALGDLRHFRPHGQRHTVPPPARRPCAGAPRPGAHSASAGSPCHTDQTYRPAGSFPSSTVFASSSANPPKRFSPRRSVSSSVVRRCCRFGSRPIWTAWMTPFLSTMTV